MGTISNSTPVLDAIGDPATHRVVLVYRRDNHQLIARGMTSDGVGDPHWNNVEVLMLARGYDGSTQFVDYSLRPKTITFASPAALTTDYAFGENASVEFDGTNGYLNIVDSALVLGTGDFCLDGFIRRLGPNDHGVDSDSQLWDLRGGSTSSPLVYVEGNNDSNALRFFAGGSDRVTGSSIAINTDYHVEVSRISGVTRLFINGVKQGSDYTDANNYSSDTIRLGTRYIALSGHLRGFYGYQGSFRYTKGAGRHTANFTPPTRFVAAPDTLGAGYYEIDTGDYDGECSVVVLDDFGGTLSDLIQRATPIP